MVPHLYVFVGWAAKLSIWVAPVYLLDLLKTVGQMWGHASVFTLDDCQYDWYELTIISSSEAVLTVSAYLHAASADVDQFWWLFFFFDTGVSSDLVRLPHPQHKLHPAWINSPPSKTFIDICRHSDARACLSWHFSSRTPLQFSSNLGLVDVGWQVKTSQWDANEQLHSCYKGKSFSHLDRVANCVKTTNTQSDQDNGLWRNEISSPLWEIWLCGWDSGITGVTLLQGASWESD